MFWRRSTCGRRRRACRKQLDIADFLRSRLTRKRGDQRGLSLDQPLQNAEDVIQLLEVVDALRPSSQLAGSLRSPQQQYTDDGGLSPSEIERFLQMMFELGDPAFRSAHHACQSKLLQP